MKAKPATIATSENPIRGSLLPNLFSCPGLFMDKIERDGDDAGDLAQTGSLTHIAIETWYKHKSEKMAIAAIAMNRVKYPLGDAEKAAQYFRKYCERDKAEPKGIVIAVESKLAARLPSMPWDKTKKEIVIMCTVDLIRDVSTCLYVIDHKTGYKPGPALVTDYAAQIAIYMVAVNQHYKRPVKGFFTRIQDLLRKDLPYYWPIKGDETTAMQVLETVRTRVGVLRMGYIDHTPGKHCDWCSMSWPGCLNGEKATPQEKVASQRKSLKTVDDLMMV